jgi:hypothetical protein
MLSLCLVALFAPSPSSLPMPTISTSVLESLAVPVPRHILVVDDRAAPTACPSAAPFSGNGSEAVDYGIRSNSIPSGISDITWFNASNTLGAICASELTGGLVRFPRHLEYGAPYALDQPYESQAVYQSGISPPALVATPVVLMVFDSGQTSAVSKFVVISPVATTTLYANATADVTVDLHLPSLSSCGAVVSEGGGCTPLEDLSPFVSAQPLDWRGEAFAKFLSNIFSLLPISCLSGAEALVATLTSDAGAIWHARSLRSCAASVLCERDGSIVTYRAPVISVQSLVSPFCPVIFDSATMFMCVFRLGWAMVAVLAATRRFVLGVSSTPTSLSSLLFEVRRSSFVLQGVRHRPVIVLLSPWATTYALLCVTLARMAKGTICLANLAAFWLVKLVVGIVYMPAGSAQFRLVLSVASFQVVQAVTCHSCYDGIPGCAGGAACPLVTGVAANAAAFLVVAGAAVVALDCSVILPLRYLRVVSKTALDCIKAVRRRPLLGTPVAIDAVAMNLDDLRAAITDGRVDRESAIAELMTRGATAANNLELTRIQFVLACVKASTDTATATRPTVTLGAFTLSLALASKVVSSSQAISSAVGGVVAATAAAEPVTSTVSSIQRATVVWPRTMEEFSSVLNAWMVIMHATGLCEFLVASEFTRLVVYDTMEHHGHSFTVAHALLLVYLERVEATVGDDININNVHSLGSMDTFMARAVTLAAQCGVARPEPVAGRPAAAAVAAVATTPAVAFNGRATPAADRSCYTFNLGRGTVHPASSLGADGTCRFKHACDQFVSDKGPRGVCGSTSHCRKDCTNAAKVSTPVV